MTSYLLFGKFDRQAILINLILSTGILQNMGAEVFGFCAAEKERELKG
jgi:hypothetical protein